MAGRVEPIQSGPNPFGGKGDGRSGITTWKIRQTFHFESSDDLPTASLLDILRLSPHRDFLLVVVEPPPRVVSWVAATRVGNLTGSMPNGL